MQDSIIQSVRQGIYILAIDNGINPVVHRSLEKPQNFIRVVDLLLDAPVLRGRCETSTEIIPAPVRFISA